MKRLLAILLVLLLLLTGCRQVPSEEPDDGTTTQQTTSDTTEDTSNNEMQELSEEEKMYALSQRIKEYFGGKEGYRVARVGDIYDQYHHYSDLLGEPRPVEDSLVVYKVLQKKATLIVSEPIVEYPTNTQDHIYYILKSEPNKVYRSDYTGAEQTLIYESAYAQIELCNCGYYGVDANGKLLMVEDGRYVTLIDVPSGQREVLVEDEYLDAYNCYLSFDYYDIEATERTWKLVWQTNHGGPGPTKIWSKNFATGEVRDITPYFGN